MSTEPGTRPEPDAHDPREGPRPPGVPPHQPPLEGADEQDRLDEEAEQSFPSSDPPAQGGPGIRP